MIIKLHKQNKTKAINNVFQPKLFTCPTGKYEPCILQSEPKFKCFHLEFTFNKAGQEQYRHNQSDKASLALENILKTA